MEFLTDANGVFKIHQSYNSERTSGIHANMNIASIAKEKNCLTSVSTILWPSYHEIMVTTA